MVNMYNFFSNYSLRRPSVINTNNINLALSVNNIDYLFYKMKNLKSVDLVNCNTSQLNGMNNTFYSCSNLTFLNLSNGDISNVQSLQNTFQACCNLVNLDLSNGNFQNIINFRSTFYTDGSLVNLDTSNGNVSNVQVGDTTFQGCSNLTILDVSNGDVSNTKLFYLTFSGCSNLTSLNVSNGNTSNVNNGVGAFSGCFNLMSLDVSNGDMSNVENLYNIFQKCNNLTILNVSNGNTSNFKNMSGMFSECEKLMTLDVSNGDTSNSRTLYATFGNCGNLTALDVSNGKTNNVSSTSRTFSNCLNLTTLDVSNGNTSNIKTVSYMFDLCSNLTALDVSNGDTSNVNDLTSTFSYCSNLTNLDIANGNVDKAISLVGMMNGCNNLTNLNIGIGNINNANNISAMFRNTGKRGNAEQDIYGLDFNWIQNGNMNNIVNMSNFLNDAKCGYFPLYNINNIQPYISTGLPNIYGNTGNVTDISGAFAFKSARPRSAEIQPNLYADGDIDKNTIHTNGFFDFSKIDNAVGTFSANSIHFGYLYEDGDYASPLTGADYGLYLNNTENMINVKNMFASGYYRGKIPFFYDTYSDAPTFNIQNTILKFNNVIDASYLFYNYQPVDYFGFYNEGEGYIRPRKILPTLILNNIVNLAFAYYNTRTPIIDTSHGNLSKVTNIKCMFSQSYALDNNSLKNIANALLTATNIPATQKNLFINNIYGPFNQTTDIHAGMAVPKIINNATIGTSLVSQLRAAGGSVPE